MLQEKGVDFEYREYRRNPLSVVELREVLGKLGLEPRQVLRTRDKAFRELDLSGEESAQVLIEHMSQHPTLLQRPILVDGERAALGRPLENLLELL